MLRVVIRAILNSKVILLLLALPFFSGCSSIIDMNKQKSELNVAYRTNASNAESIVNKKVKARSNTGDEIAWLLEEGSLYFHLNKYQDSLNSFNRASQLMAEYDRRALVSVRDVGAEAGGAIVNPNSIPYRGMSKDRILLPLYNAFNRLAMGEEDNFRVEIRRMREAQSKVAEEFSSEINAEAQSAAQVQQKNQANLSSSNLNANSLGLTPDAFVNQPTVSPELQPLQQHSRPEYGNFLNPFATFMSGYSYWRDSDVENALIEFKKLYDAFPDSALCQALYATSLRFAGRQVPVNLQSSPQMLTSPNSPSVLVVFASGMTANYVQRKFQIVLPYVGYTGFAYPVCQYNPSPFSNLMVSVESGSVNTYTLADMDAVVSAEYSARLPMLITRTVINFLSKEAMATAAFFAARESGNEWVVLATILSSSAYKYMFNTADTRCWELLPKEYQIALLPMPSNRQVNLNLGGSSAVVNIPAESRSAIIWVNAPTFENISYKLFNFNN